MKDEPFIATGEWLLAEGAKLVAAIRNRRNRPTETQIRMAKELRGRAAHWKTQMDRLTDAN